MNEEALARIGSQVGKKEKENLGFYRNGLINLQVGLYQDSQRVKHPVPCIKACQLRQQQVQLQSCSDP
jgi:hypothetical protein